MNFRKSCRLTGSFRILSGPGTMRRPAPGPSRSSVRLRQNLTGVAFLASGRCPGGLLAGMGAAEPGRLGVASGCLALTAAPSSVARRNANLALLVAMTAWQVMHVLVSGIPANALVSTVVWQ